MSTSILPMSNREFNLFDQHIYAWLILLSCGSGGRCFFIIFKPHILFLRTKYLSSSNYRTFKLLKSKIIFLVIIFFLSCWSLLQSCCLFKWATAYHKLLKDRCSNAQDDFSNDHHVLIYVVAITIIWKVMGKKRSNEHKGWSNK